MRLPGTLSLFHAVISRCAVALFSLRRNNPKRGTVMKTLLKLLIPMGIMAMAGCVVAPYGYHRGYYGPRVAVFAPAPLVVAPPVVVVRP
jgi:hypothetical protein